MYNLHLALFLVNNMSVCVCAKVVSRVHCQIRFRYEEVNE